VATAPTVQNVSRYWVVPLVRAAVALAAGFAITFTANHNSRFGLIVFGIFAVVSGILVAILSWRLIADSVIRWLLVGQGLLGVLAGVLALSLHESGLGLYLFLVSVWAVLTGVIELYCGGRKRSKSAASRDWFVVGIMTVVLALVFWVIPPDAVLAIGLFGAYAVIIGVYLGIGAFSLRWSTQHPATAATSTLESGS
jgi:uncharacterized membrane protein HdeD (DUF308 family)